MHWRRLSAGSIEAPAKQASRKWETLACQLHALHGPVQQPLGRLVVDQKSHDSLVRIEKPTMRAGLTVQDSIRVEQRQTTRLRTGEI